ncbi:protein-methionine sulfoxide oxidase mical2b isoform X1 [Oryzias melastigma]|uniref:protein-methionine sulfoxide oxidase mical2b isoform X1 n=1 Tax=Oryzias melastigma TaxID=30732 RepID=UPI000CF83BAA|nr:protein-methionine sulfoxide oxidase mical2b isoform X1 [Oryzias melastigma]
MGETEDERTARASQLFENFVQASTCKGTLQAFSILCRQLELDPLDCSNFYSSLKAAVSSWKVKALWAKLDKRAQQKVYNQNKACQGTRCLIIGGGPCGLRTAIELALLGCKVVVMEKRDTFSRNNVLHLWPYTIHDLKSLGAKKFYGKFCAGSLDHISIRQLQLMLLKVSLILGVEIHVNVEFVKLLEPPEEQNEDGPGWRAEVRPENHPVSNFDFDVVIGADGRKNTLDGFRRKEFRGKLAIAITANFVNRNTTAEAKVEEISGVAFIFNQKFFLDLKEETGIDLENIVYYKDNTHYFVMTAKKQSLLDKGVILNDFIETERLLGADNVSQEALCSYAREAADFATNYELPSLDFAINHYRQPDVAMFDFTCMYASENAALIREKHGHQLLVALVGDSLLEPFWPLGTGCARGFLAAFDAAWMVRGWAHGKSPLEILAERESIYRLLPQTTTENISKNFELYSIDPSTRYPNLNSSCVRPQQVRHLYIGDHHDNDRLEKGVSARRSVNLSRKESEVRPGRLLAWCQDQTRGYRGVDVKDLTSSWRNGLALCALIHQQRPDLIDYDSLKEEDVAANNQLAFDVAEREFGIQPVTTGREMAAQANPDKLLMVLYLSRFYEAFRSSPGNGSKEADENIKENSDTNHSLPGLLLLRKRTPREDKHQEEDSVHKRRRKGNDYLSELSCHSAPPAGEDAELQENNVRSLATRLQAKFEENSSMGTVRTKSIEDPLSPSPSSSESSSPTFPLSDEEEEEEEEGENPRFAKPKDPPAPPPLAPPPPKWQPSVYLRLLENPPAAPPSGSGCSRSPSPSEGPPTASCFSDSSASPFCVSASSPDPASEQQGTNSRPSTREFSKRSIEERAALLSSMFGAPVSGWQVKSSSSASSSPPPPPAAPRSASETFPVVHPVPDPTAQAAFALDPPADKSRDPTPSSSSPPSRKKSSPHAAPVCSPSTDEALKISDLQRTNEQEEDQSAPWGGSDHRNLAENDHMETVEMKINTQTQLVQGTGGCDAELSRRNALKFRSNSCPTGAPSYSKERTVGKVSSSINAKAQILAILYETDHRPNAPPCVKRRDGPPGLGGSDICHFCAKRVYVMERLSAEGFFFHRECFRCDVCRCVLRLGGHTFDSQGAKFYCRIHSAQRQSSIQPGRSRRRPEDQGHAKPSPLDGGICSPTGSGQMRPPGEAERHRGDPGDAEMAVEALEASCIITPSEEESSKGQSSSKNHLKRKIRFSFPLVFKSFQRSRPETVPEVDSDAEENCSSGKPASSQCGSHSSQKERSEDSSAAGKAVCSPSKKRLVLSSVKREEFLRWEDPITPSSPQEEKKEQVRADVDELQANRSQSRAPSQSAFQALANAFRRTFRRSSSTTVVMRPKRDGVRKHRPASDGAFTFSSLFCVPESTVDGKRLSCHNAQWASVDADPWGAGQDLPSLLQKVAIKDRRASEGAFGDSRSGPRKRVDLFSSLRLRRKGNSEETEQEAQHDIQTILSNFRNKASSQQNLDELSSSEDENENMTSNHMLPPEKMQKKQERVAALQAKREELKRLHRAQVIQRQLEEVGEKHREIEERGVKIEKIIRGETDSAEAEDSDEAQLYQSWFKLVLEKNRLARYESELMIFAQELQLEDTQSRLQQELRHRMAVEDTNKSASELQEEQEILAQIMSTVEKRDTLVSILEEQRLKERAEDKDLESLVLSKGYEFHWAQGNDSWGREKQELYAHYT